MDVLFSERRNAVASRRCFERAIDRSRAAPARGTQGTTNRVGAYPPALRQVLPAVEHRDSKSCNNGIEHDHQHLKQRLRPIRGGKRRHAADTVTHGHAHVQQRRNGVSTLTAEVPRHFRLATA